MPFLAILRRACLALFLGHAAGAAANPGVDTAAAEAPPTAGELLEQGRLAMFGAQPQDALALFTRAAQAGAARALGAIGELHARGIGVAQSASEAAQWYRRAIAAGDQESRARLGLAVLRGPAATSAALREGLALVQQSSERGNAFGHYALGRLLLEGLLLRRDEARGLALVEQAARGEVPEAQSLLGQFYADGREVAAAHSGMAAELLTQAARNGDVAAQARLGAFYRDGRGVERDAPEAAYWLEKAASAGNTEAAADLGLMLVEGTAGLRRDLDAGLHWLKIAAGQGFAPAQYHLGVALLEGRGYAAAAQRLAEELGARPAGRP